MTRVLIFTDLNTVSIDSFRNKFRFETGHYFPKALMAILKIKLKI